MEAEYILILRQDHKNIATKLNINVLLCYLSYGYFTNVEPNYKKSLTESFFYVKLSKRDDVTRFFCSLNTILLRVSMDIVEACFVAIYPFCCLNLQIYRILHIVVVVYRYYA